MDEAGLRGEARPKSNVLRDPSSSASAAGLFEEASVARRAGDAAQAAAILKRFLASYSSDPRAGLAAFELGRLQMDSLGRPGEALGAFQRALRLSPGASFREDVLARIARAYARMGQEKACFKARETYEREYPDGVHQAGLRRACPD
jgi:transmembrane sensor